MITNKLNVTDLDYDSIKTSLVKYLKSQDTFKDYNFESSGLNVIIEMLAYNSHYQALMANFVANEMYLETAVKRSSVVSRAKELGYIPKSKAAAKAVVTVYSNTQDPKMNIGTVFNGILDNNAYSFVTLSPHIGTLDAAGKMKFDNVVLYEGAIISNTFTYSSKGQILTIPNLDIDITTVSVKDESNTYSPVDNYINLTNQDKVFFVQEGFDGYYQIYFGDGVLGKSPDLDQTITITYLVTTGSTPNGIDTFSYANDATTVVQTVFKAQSGAEREDTETIKMNAVNYYGVQNRAVTHLDYKALIQTSGIQLNGLNVWGGEDETPPKYGTVVVCADPELTATQKSTITQLLKNKSVEGSNVKFTLPDYNDLAIDVTANVNKTTQIDYITLTSAIENAVNRYLQNTFNVFDGELKYSSLLATISNVDSSITSNLAKITLFKTIGADLFSRKSFSFSFVNSINTTSVNPTILSTEFLTDEFNGALHIEDDRKGNLVMYSADKTSFSKIIGSVNYSSGEYSFGPINIVSVDDITIIAQPENLDIFAKKNTIFRSPKITVKLTYE
jgi:hypothetical protein